MCNDCSSLRIVKSTSWRQISYIKCVPPYVALQHIIQHLHGLCSRFALSEARKTSQSRAAPRGEKRGREKGRGKPRTPPRLPPASERARREREDRQWWGFASKQEVIHLEVRRTLGWKHVADYKLKFGPRCAIRSALLCVRIAASLAIWGKVAAQEQDSPERAAARTHDLWSLCPKTTKNVAAGSGSSEHDGMRLTSHEDLRL